jgi:hypothetical protein
MRILAIVGLGILMVYSGGCAKLLRGETQTMKFDSEPQGALVKVGANEVTTPGEVKLQRKDKYEVTVSKAGYRTIVFEMVAQWDGASLGNMVMPGGSIGLATDTATGSDRNFYKIAKIKLQAATDPNTPPLKLIQYRGKLYTDEDYKKVQEEERRYREWYFED